MTRAMMLMTAMAATLATAALADTKAGYDLWNRGDYYGAVDQWRGPAVAGDAEAQYNLAQAYKLGRGVSVDLKMAEGWYAKAAAQGNIPARDNYGLMLFQNGDRQAAMPYIEEAANRGEPRAQYVLGTALFNGDMVKKDWVRAYALMTRASASGIAAASASLAQMDKYIPLDQRQRGLALARSLENNASRPQMAALGASRGPNLVGTEELPPSRAATPEPVGAPPVVTAPQRPLRQDARPTTPQLRPVPVERPKPVERPRPVERDVEQIVERPAPAPAARPAVGGNWRVQLAAFGDASKVQPAWTALRSRVPALAPYRLIPASAGAVTRLQAGPLPTRAAADKLCAAVKASGAACLPVAP